MTAPRMTACPQVRTKEQFEEDIAAAMRKMGTAPYTNLDKNQEILHKEIQEPWRQLQYLKDEDQYLLGAVPTYAQMIEMLQDETRIGEPHLIDQCNCVNWAEQQLGKSGFTIESTTKTNEIAKKTFGKLLAIPPLSIQRRKDSVIEENDFKQLKFDADLIAPEDPKGPLAGRVVNYDKQRRLTPEELKDLKKDTKTANKLFGGYVATSVVTWGATIAATCVAGPAVGVMVWASCAVPATGLGVASAITKINVDEKRKKLKKDPKLSNYIEQHNNKFETTIKMGGD
jgi:hypothetical protein